MDRLLHFGRQDTDPDSRFVLHLLILAVFLAVVAGLIKIVSCETNTGRYYEVGLLVAVGLLVQVVLDKRLELVEGNKASLRGRATEN